jgi:hypothetical protein
MPSQIDIPEEKKNLDEIRKVTAWDILLVIVFIAAALSFIPVFYTSQPARVVVYKDNNVYAEYQLKTDREFNVKGYEGNMNVRIINNQVYIQSSTCKEQICVKTGKIGRSYQQLICAPNHILIEIHTNKVDKTIDAITR